MKFLRKIAQEFKVVFESNRCRFARKCKAYQIEAAICNNWYKRFPTFEKAHCGKYRSMEDEEKE